MGRSLAAASRLGRCLGALSLLAMVGTAFAADHPSKPDPGELKKRLEQLRSLPYTSVSPTGDEAGAGGVSIHDASRAYRGYNLYCIAEATTAVLMDMEGAVVHRWTVSLPGAREFDHASLLPNGNLLAVATNHSALVLSWDSEIIHQQRLAAHHDMCAAGDGTYYTLSYRLHKYRDLDFRFCTLVHLSAELQPLREWSTYRSLDEIKMKFDRRSFTDGLIDSIIAAGGSPGEQQTILGKFGVRNLPWGLKVYDYFHLNSVSLLPETPLGGDARFRAGNILTCARNVNQIAILDGQTLDILWVWGEGDLQWPHHPTMLSSGNILVFDNGVISKRSRVLEINPSTLAVEWEYAGNPPEGFYSFAKGSAQRLPNGNTLICEGERGRAFVVPREGQTVWEWFNPVLKSGRRVTLYRMERIAPEVVQRLLAQ